MYKFLTLLIFLFLFQTSEAIEIKGKNIGYAGKKFVFYRYSDPVSKTPEEQFTIQFKADGSFFTNIDVKKTSLVYCEFGIYKGMFILEPEKSLELRFPPLREKSFADQKNPFFEPVSFWFNTKENSVTNQISRFDNTFNQLTDKYFNRLYFRQSREVYDSVVYFLNRDFPKSENELLEIHKTIKIKSLESDVFRLRTEEVAPQISAVNPDFWILPSFRNFFEKLFNDRLSFDSKDLKQNELKAAVGKSDLKYLRNYLNTKYKLEGESVDLVLIKILHDAFYKGEFSKSSIINMLNSESFTKNNTARIRQTSTLVLEKLKFLLPGTTAPVICLNDFGGQKKCTNSKNMRFKYLIFADTEMIVCKEHLKYLSSIEEKFGKYLEIFVIFRNTEKAQTIAFLKEFNIAGIHLSDSGNEFIKKYKVKSFPQSYLLDKDHRVVFPETKTPMGGFEQQFAPYLRKHLFEGQRNQSR